MKHSDITTILFILALAAGTTFAHTNCFQDSANVSTACGGLNTGLYDMGNWAGTTNPEYSIDANWGTTTINLVQDAENFFNITYMRPVWSAANATWQVNFTLNTTQNMLMNLTLDPVKCNMSSSYYRVLIDIFPNESNGYMSLSCQQSAGNWAPLYALGNPSNITGVSFTEEGVFWSMEDNALATINDPTNTSYNTGWIDFNVTCSGAAAVWNINTNATDGDGNVSILYSDTSLTNGGNAIGSLNLWPGTYDVTHVCNNGSLTSFTTVETFTVNASSATAIINEPGNNTYGAGWVNFNVSCEGTAEAWNITTYAVDGDGNVSTLFSDVPLDNGTILSGSLDLWPGTFTVIHTCDNASVFASVTTSEIFTVGPTSTITINPPTNTTYTTHTITFGVKCNGSDPGYMVNGIVMNSTGMAVLFNNVNITNGATATTSLTLPDDTYMMLAICENTSIDFGSQTFTVDVDDTRIYSEGMAWTISNNGSGTSNPLLDNIFSDTSNLMMTYSSLIPLAALALVGVLAIGYLLSFTGRSQA